MNTAKEPGVCRLCDRRKACRTWELTSKACEQLDDIAEHSDVLSAGHRLWELHEPIRGLHIIRSGAFKCSRSYSDDHERVLGFTFPTELVGIDGIYVGLHQSAAVALEDSRLCSFSLSKLTPLMDRHPDLRALVTRLLSNTLHHPDLDGARSPEQRIADFLMNLSRRAFRRGAPATDVDLPMSPAEMGSYLQIPAETVSAVLVHLARHRQIDIGAGHVRLLKPELLQVLASA
jgi:CRP/FNR family transcriptional regulator, anaerobic regulatory protein